MSSVSPEALLLSLLLGAGLGLLFTALESLRILLSLGRVVTALLDVLFCIITAGSSFVLALAVAHGSLRFFQSGCEILGFLCIHQTCTYAVRRFLPQMIRKLRSLYQSICKRMNAVEKKILRKKKPKKVRTGKKCRFFGISAKKTKKRLE